MDKDMFFTMFCGLFEAPNMVGNFALARGYEVAGLPLQSLPIHEGEIKQARDASDALYDTLVEMPMFHWMLELDGKWMPRIVAIGVFSFGKANAVSAELNARAARDAARKPKGETVEATATEVTPDASPEPARAESDTGNSGDAAAYPSTVEIDEMTGQAYDTATGAYLDA